MPSAEDNHLMHIMLQKPTPKSTREAKAHFVAHLMLWQQTGKPMSL
jgi:hypothetical protein